MASLHSSWMGRGWGEEWGRELLLSLASVFSSVQCRGLCWVVLKGFFLMENPGRQGSALSDAFGHNLSPLTCQVMHACQGHLEREPSHCSLRPQVGAFRLSGCPALDRARG